MSSSEWKVWFVGTWLKFCPLIGLFVYPLQWLLVNAEHAFPLHTFVVALPTCYTADWWFTLDSPGWALCNTDNYRQPYLRGFRRSVNIGDGGLWLLEYGNCCGAVLSSYVHQPVTCLDQNWDTVLNGWGRLSVTTVFTRKSAAFKSKNFNKRCPRISAASFQQQCSAFWLLTWLILKAVTVDIVIAHRYLFGCGKGYKSSKLTFYCGKKTKTKNFL